MKMQRLYWSILPFDWRPGQIWYRIKCFLWHRYSTVKPRYLSHTWTDRCEIMPHIVFEVLSQFLEKECSPGWIEWYGESGHKIGDKFVRDEMQELYDWWHEIYNKLYPAVCERLWKKVEKYSAVTNWVEADSGDFFEYSPKWATEKDKKKHELYLDAIGRLEDRMAVELKDNLRRIIEITPYMWT